MVHYGFPAFDAPIEAWAEGPVVRRIFERHKRRRHLHSWSWGDAARVSISLHHVIRDVLRRYGSRSAEELSTLTHGEQPWRRARAGFPPGARSSRQIDPREMREFYGRGVANPARAVNDVIASARLEGGDTSAEEHATLMAIAAGRASADEVVREITAHVP